MITAIATALQTEPSLAAAANAVTAEPTSPSLWVVAVVLSSIVFVPMAIILGIGWIIRRQNAKDAPCWQAEQEKAEANRKLACGRERLISHRVNRVPVPLRVAPR